MVKTWTGLFKGLMKIYRSQFWQQALDVDFHDETRLTSIFPIGDNGAYEIFAALTKAGSKTKNVSLGQDEHFIKYEGADDCKYIIVGSKNNFQTFSVDNTGMNIKLNHENKSRLINPAKWNIVKNTLNSSNVSPSSLVQLIQTTNINLEFLQLKFCLFTFRVF